MANLKHTVSILPMLLLVLLATPHTTFAQDQENGLQKRVESFRQAQEDFHQRPSRFDRQQQFLVRALDAFLKHADILSERIAQLSVVQEELAEALRAEIQGDIIRLQEFQQRVQATQSSQELQKIAEELREHRGAMQHRVWKLTLLAHVDVYEHRILQIASQRADSIAQELDEFEGLGNDVAELETLLAQAKETIATASEELEQLKQHIAEDQVDITFLAQAHQTFHGIRSKVRNSYALFRQIAYQAAEL